MKQIARIVEEIETAQETIEGSFWWKDTPQGPDYWAEVYENLDAVRLNMLGARHADESRGESQ